jgi:hypothetical protein
MSFTFMLIRLLLSFCFRLFALEADIAFPEFPDDWIENSGSDDFPVGACESDQFADFATAIAS